MGSGYQHHHQSTGCAHLEIDLRHGLKLIAGVHFFIIQYVWGGRVKYLLCIEERIRIDTGDERGRYGLWSQELGFSHRVEIEKTKEDFDSAH
jgi:hypothetical protein